MNAPTARAIRFIRRTKVKTAKPAIWAGRRFTRLRRFIPRRSSLQRPAADSAALQAAQNELEQAQKNLEDGKKVRYGNERNYARYLDRVQNLENAVKVAEQKVNSAKIGNSSLARPMMH